ncbi:unnamed protein product [Pelagomonas calceolata]|uniref:Orotidine 5'-phosphate decarboxylase n=1 Tax=Pelagomonas calceolata TaxID=35677 RepID=A0A7S4A676_9STRA|nr:unnamed protein product [Pelagomonas calceolata]
MSATPGFFEALAAQCKAKDSYLCVGLDPRTATAEEAHDVCCRLIDATKTHACCYKPNAAFFEAHGAAGWAALKGVIEKIHAVGSLCLLDCKRGDVGSTAQAYAKACYDDLKADAVTLSPYLGYDAIQPFVTGQYAGKGAFILCATSNPSADEMQSDALRDRVASLSSNGGAWGVKTAVASRPLGLVVGATRPAAVSAARTQNGDAWLLTPGVGAQGADASTVVRAALSSSSRDVRLVVPVSRAIMNADDPSAAAQKLCQEIRDAISNAPPPPSLTDTLADASRRLSDTMTSTFPRTAELLTGGALKPHQAKFVGCVLRSGALKFGSFQLKSGRQSPYFFNAGLVCDGNDAAEFFDAYAAAIQNSGLEFDVVFGPAYKGIPLCAGVSAALAARGVSSSFAYNRKEAKDHGEGGTLVGAAVKGRRVLLVDDVISAGTAVREATGILAKAGAILVGVCVAVDRQEVTGGSAPPAPGSERVSAVEGVRRELGVPVVPILTLTDLLAYLEAKGGSDEHAANVRKYRETYGAC